MSEPHDLTLEILRDMRGDVASIKASVAEQGARLKRMERFMTHVVGLHAMSEGDIDDLRRRVETLEERVGPPQAE